MKTNFERGQLNAQDDLNANFIEIGQLIKKSYLPVTLIDGIEGQISNVTGPNNKEIGVGDTVYYTADTKPVSVNSSTHKIVVEEDGIYCFVMQVWAQFSTNHNGYFYINMLKNGTRAPGQNRLWGTGADALKNRNDATGIYIASLVAGDEINAAIETNYAGTIANSGIKSVLAVKIL
ncbi:hypothetical protein [Enterococcus faecalis]|uniref:hypothetical protein n=1 Tax=Enterococcus faecalis TaxID=1351 RepID=UPI001D172538|nr:hypothetical protein [Enterococcus faecalis]MCC4082958.1 hypothetical protein [Enterococcus faecalis]